MKTTILLIAASLLLAGCASLEEAYYVDHEFGQAAQQTWDMQVAYPDYRYVYDRDGRMKNPEELAGIAAEEVMDVHTETYAEKPTEAGALTFSLID
jgi:hypothetical protein